MFLLLVRVLLSALLLVVVTGAGTLVLAPPRWRTALLPGLPVVGAISLALGLHATALVVGVDVGLPVLLVLCAGVLIWRRRVVWELLRSRQLLWAGALLAAGLVGILLVIAPAAAYGPGVVDVTANHDSFSYVTVADWLVHHRALNIPRPGAAEFAPGWGYVFEHLSFGLRIGQSLDLAATSVLSRVSTDQAWYATTAFWLGLLPGGVFLFLQLLGCRRWLACAAGSLAGIAAVENYALFNGNSDAALGLVVAPLAMAVIFRVLDVDVTTRAPLWLGGWAAAGMIGIYTEFYPVLLASMGVYGLLLGPRRWVRAGLRWLAMAGVAIALAPLVAWNAFHSVVVTAHTFTGIFPSPFLDVPPSWAVNRILGVSPFWDTSHLSIVTVALSGLLLAGLALAALTPAWRAYLAIVVGAAAPIALFSTVMKFPYGQERLVQITAPMLFGIAVGGYEGLTRIRVPAVPPRVLIGAVGLAAVAGTALYVRANVHTAIYWQQYPGVGDRVEGPEFDEAATWLAANAGPRGEQGMVVAGDYFDQLWMLYAVRNLPATEIPFVYPDYANVPAFSGNLHSLRRYIVVERDDLTFASPGVVVGGNKRFDYLDTSRGEFLLTLPALHTLDDQEAAETNGGGFWMGDAASVLFVHSSGIQTITLQLQPNAALAPLPVSIETESGGVLATQDLPAGGAAVPLRLDDPVELIRFENGTPAVALGNGDPRIASLRLAGVRAG